MPLMTWNSKLSVGVDRFDDQHKKLVSMINELFDGMQAGKGKEALGPILDSLVKYTASHFAEEERAMAAANYAGLEAHKKEHAALVKQVREVQAKYNQGATALLSLEVMNFLKNWLINHIQGTDKKYSAVLSQTGAAV